MAVNLGSAVAYLDLDTTKFQKGFKTALTDLNVFGSKSATATQKIQGMSKAFGSAGRTMTLGVTVPLLGLGTAAIKAGADFDTGMSEVEAISGATAKQMGALRDKAIELGAKTKFSASESAEAFKYMAQAGWKTEDMLSGISGVMNLAAASGEDLGLVSDIVTDSLTAFGLSAQDSAMFADVLAKAASDTNTDVAQMGETFQYVAPVAGALGYSIQDVAVAVGVMANSGIKGSHAGTALRSTLTNLAKPTKTMAAVMDEYGISLTDTQGNMKPLSELLVDMRGKFAGMSEEEKAANAATLAGKEGMAGLLAIMNASDEDFAKVTEGINNSAGAAEKMAKIMQDNLGGAFEQLGGALESLAIAFSDVLKAKVESVVDSLTKFIEKLNSMSEEQKRVILNIALFVAAIGPMLLIFSNMLKMVVALKNGFVLLKGLLFGTAEGAGLLKGAVAALASPITWVIAGIAGLVGILVHLYKTNEEFRTRVSNAWQEVKNNISAALNEIKEPMATLKQSFGDIWAAIEPLAMIVGTILLEAFKALSIVLADVIRLFGEILQGVSEIITWVLQAVDTAKQKFEEFGTFAQTLWESIKQAFQNGWNAIVEFFTISIPAWIESVKAWFADLPTNAGILVGKLIGYVYLFAQSVWTWITTELPLIIQGVVDWFAQLPSRIWTWLVGVVNNVISWGSDMKAKASETGRTFVDNLVNFFKELPGKVWEWISQVPTKVAEVGKQLYDAGRNIMNDLWDGIKSIGESIVGWFSDFADNIGKFVSGIVKGFQSVVSGADDAKKASKSVDGKHATGLDYVPYNGYIAELHEGEKVLTKQQSREYDKGGRGSSGGDTFVFQNVKPTPYEYARQIKKAKRELAEDF